LNRLIHTLILSAVLSSSAQALTIRWEGPRPEGAVQLERTLLAAVGGATQSASTGQAKLGEILAAREYYWAKFRWQADTLMISAGPRGVPGAVTIQPEGIDSSGEKARLFSSTLGRRTHAAAVERALYAVIEELVQGGHPFAQARVVSIDVATPPDVDFVVMVYPGPMVVGGALSTGAERTRPQVFERQAAWRRGRLITGAVIENSRAAIASLPSVLDVDTARLEPTVGDTANLLLGVKEANAIQIRGLLGYVPPTSQVSGYWVGEAALRLRSPFGDGRSAAVTAGRRERESRHTELEYWEPWPANLPFWVGLRLRQDDFDTSFIETEIAGSLRLASGGRRFEAQGVWSKITPEEAPDAQTFPARRHGVTVVMADSGSSGDYRFSVDWTRHLLFRRGNLEPPAGRVNHTRGRFLGHRIVRMSQRSFLQIIGDGGGMLTSSAYVPPDLLFRVGGVRSLRGYREEQFLLKNYLRLAVELHAGSRLQSLFVFGEGGWLDFPLGPARLVGAFGAGLNIARRLELTVAVPSEGGFDQTKVHIGLSTGR